MCSSQYILTNIRCYLLFAYFSTQKGSFHLNFQLLVTSNTFFHMLFISTISSFFYIAIAYSQSRKPLKNNLIDGQSSSFRQSIDKHREACYQLEKNDTSSPCRIKPQFWNKEKIMVIVVPMWMVWKVPTALLKCV